MIKAYGGRVFPSGITGGKTKATLLRYAVVDQLPCFTSCHFFLPFLLSFYFTFLPFRLIAWGIGNYLARLKQA